VIDDDPLRGLPDDREWSHEVYGGAVRAKHADGACTACGSSSWEVGQDLFLIPALDPAGRLVNGRGVEAILVYCRHCGLLRAHAAGVLFKGLERPADTSRGRRLLARILPRYRPQDLDHRRGRGRDRRAARGRRNDLADG
jgi:hypothetical protein